MADKPKAPDLGVQFTSKQERVEEPSTSAAPAKKTEKSDGLQEVMDALQERFKGDKAQEFENKRVYIRLESKPARVIRIGVDQGIHTYVKVLIRHGKLVAQLYASIPSDFHNLIVPELKEVGVNIDSTPFTRPSGL